MPDYNEYLDSIYSLLQPFLKEGVSLTEDTELVTELGLTSLQVMSMIEQIEDLRYLHPAEHPAGHPHRPRPGAAAGKTDAVTP